VNSVFAAVVLLTAQAAPPEGFVELTGGFVPNANDVPLMVGAGLRFAEVHELWARLGSFTTGDDVRHFFGVAGYKLVLRPRRVVRPFFGALVAGLPATCGHDADGRPSCTGEPLFILSATGGVRFELVPWLGISAALLLGADTFPNPFGMVELGVTFSYPQP
jgi:hypothetical protein